MANEDIIYRIMNSPKFGDLMKNRSFAQLLTQQIQAAFIPSESESSNLAKLLPMLQYAEQNGQQGFVYKPSGEFIGRTSANQPLSEVFQEAQKRFEKSSQFTSETIFKGSKVNSYEWLTERLQRSKRTGAYQNRRLELLAENTGMSIRRRTVATKETASMANEFSQSLLVPDSDVTTVVDFFDKVSGKQVTFEEVFQKLGITAEDAGTLAKRLKALTNDRAIEIARWVEGDPASRLKGAVFSSSDFVMKDAVMKELIKDIPDADKAEFAKKMLDGINFMPEAAAERIIESMDKEIQRIKSLRIGKEAEKHIADLTEYKDMVASQLKGARESKSGFGSGSFNVRAIGLHDILSNDPLKDIIEHLKGNLTIVRNDILQGLMEQLGEFQGKDIQEILKTLDILSPDVNRKSEFLAKVYSAITLEKDSAGKAARINPLTASAFSNLVNQDDYLSQSMASEIKSLTEAIENNVYSPGLKSLVEDMIKQEIPDNLSPVEKAMLQESQTYAKEFKAFMEGGGDLRVSPTIKGNMFKAIDEHLFAYRSGRFGKTISLGGREVPYLGLKLPLEQSMRSYIVAEPALLLKKENTAAELLRTTIGTLGYNSELNQLILHPFDVAKHYKAFGGFDGDDSLYIIHQYDSTQKRLLALTLRDPNEVGEYAYFDADIRFNDNFPKEIRDLAQRQHEIRAQLMSKNNLSKNRERLVNELNTVSEELDDIFMGRKEIKGFNARAIKEVNLEKMLDPTNQYQRIYAPVGTRYNTEYAQGNLFRGNRIIDPAMVTEDFIDTEIRRLAEDKSNVFRYDEGASEYVKETGFFRDPLEELRKLTPEAEKNLLAAEAQKELLGAEAFQEKMLQRLDNLVGVKGTLGQAVNQLGVIDDVILSYQNLERLKAAGLTEQQGKVFIDEFSKILRDSKFQRIDRETIIDALTKLGGNDKGMTEIIKGMFEHNFKNLGVVLAQMQDHVQTNNLGIDIGLDEFLGRTRVPNAKNQQTIVNAFNEQLSNLTNEEVKKTFDDLLLPKGSKFSTAANLVEDSLKQRAKLAAQERESIKSSVDFISEQLKDFTPTAETEQITSRLIDTYNKAKQQLSEYNNLPDAEKLEILKEASERANSGDVKIMEDLVNNVMFTRNNQFINSQLMMELHQAGLLEKGKSNELRDVMLSLQKRVADAAQVKGADIRGIYDILSLTSNEGDVGISKLANKALMDFRTNPELDKIMNYTAKEFFDPDVNPFLKKKISEEGEEEFLEDFAGVNKLTVRHESLKGLDEIAVKATLMKKTLHFRQVAEFNTTSADPLFRDKRVAQTDQIIDDLARSLNKSFRKAKGSGAIGSEVIDNMKSSLLSFQRNIKNYRKQPSSIYDINTLRQRKGLRDDLTGLIQQSREATGVESTNLGKLRYAERVRADEVADAVIGGTPASRGITKFTDGIRKLMKEEPLFKKGVMAAGVFAAVGIAYGAIKGRTSEDMQGPPLLPGGSAYESFDARQTSQMSSIYSAASSRGMNEGMLYKVDVSGISNPEQFRDQLSKITGSSINSTIYKQRQTQTLNANSQQRLNSRLDLNA